MSLNEIWGLLFEKLSAQVHQSEDIIAIANLVEKEFNPPNNYGWGYTCLIAQTFYTVKLPKTS